MTAGDTQASEQAQPRTEPPAPAGPAVGAAPVGHRISPWVVQMEDHVAVLYRWLMRPRVRLAVIGIVLLLLAAVLMTNSVWTLPLVIVGLLMVVVAWIGHRLDGRFGFQWGEEGAELMFRATIKPATRTALPAAGASTDVEAGSLAGGEAAPSPEIIEGEAHTVEIDVAELKALIAAAEASEPEPPRPADLRVHRLKPDETRSAEAGR